MRTHERKHSAIAPGAGRTVEEVGRKVDADKLVGTDEIAERLGLSSYSRVHELRRRNPDFPAPIKTLRRAMVWYWPDVERWARATGRLRS